MEVKCIKSLYKSTYNNFAFVKGHSYTLLDETAEFYNIIDTQGCAFNFHKGGLNDSYYYIFSEYFQAIQTDYKPEITFWEKCKKFICAIFRY